MLTVTLFEHAGVQAPKQILFTSVRAGPGPLNPF